MTISKAGRPRRKRDPDEIETEDSGASNGIRAMLVGLGVLQALGAARRPLPLRDIAAASGLTPSRVHRYLTSLLKVGFVRQDEGSGQYELGQAAVELGLLALGQLEPIKVGIRALRAFSEESGLDGHLAVWGTAGPTVVRWQSGRLGYQIKIDEGRVLPLLWSATGRVLMAYRPLEEVMPLAEAELAQWNKEHADAPVDRGGIENMCAAVRAQGMSSSLPREAESANGRLLDSTFPRPYRLQMETVSVPIFDRLGRAPMALTFFGADHVSLRDRKSQYIERLRAASALASKDLGYG